MRGSDGMQETPFTMAKLKELVSYDHSMGPVQRIANAALVGLSDLFKQICLVRLSIDCARDADAGGRSAVGGAVEKPAPECLTRG